MDSFVKLIFTFCAISWRINLGCTTKKKHPGSLEPGWNIVRNQLTYVAADTLRHRTALGNRRTVFLQDYTKDKSIVLNGELTVTAQTFGHVTDTLGAVAVTAQDGHGESV